MIMLDEKLLAILSHPVDRTVSIETMGNDGPHLVNTWNSYIDVTPDNQLLIPAGGFKKTEKNLSTYNEVTLSIASREMEGYKTKGISFTVKGSTRFLRSGEEFDRMKGKFSWVRAVLEVTVTSTKQIL
jgi:hypothetical protein